MRQEIYKLTIGKIFLTCLLLAIPLSIILKIITMGDVSFMTAVFLLSLLLLIIYKDKYPESADKRWTKIALEVETSLHSIVPIRKIIINKNKYILTYGKIFLTVFISFLPIFIFYEEIHSGDSSRVIKSIPFVISIVLSLDKTIKPNDADTYWITISILFKKILNDFRLLFKSTTFRIIAVIIIIVFIYFQHQISENERNLEIIEQLGTDINNEINKLPTE